MPSPDRGFDLAGHEHLGGDGSQQVEVAPPGKDDQR